jgi:UDP-glucuronate 4-epimerase
MRIAVFGGKGFIGREFVRIAPKEHEFFLFGRPDADVRKSETFAEKFKKIKPDAVVNLSAIIGTLRTTIPVREMFETNTLGALNVAYAAREAGARAYLYTSSTVVHGENKKGEPHSRLSSFAPKHPYAASKAAAEFGLEQFAKEGGDMVVLTLRPPMVIGAGTDIPLPPIEFVRAVSKGKDIEIFGDGLHEREFVSVGDVARGIFNALGYSQKAEKGYYPFFLTGNRVSMRVLAEKVVKKFGGKIAYVPSTKQAFSLTTDPVDSERLLGWQVHDDLDAILDEVRRFVSLGREA